MPGKKYLPMLVFALLVYFAITNPTEAAHAVHGAAGAFKQTAAALGTFVKELS